MKHTKSIDEFGRVVSIEQKQSKAIHVFYLDECEGGIYAISLDEHVIYTFDNLPEADKYFNSF